MTEVASRAIGFWIKSWMPIHEENVLVMAVVQLELKRPRPVRLALHRKRSLVPVVEIAGNCHGLRLRCEAGKVHWLGHPFGRVPIRHNFPFDIRKIHLLLTQSFQPLTVILVCNHLRSR